jgi:hypothetical protein
MLVPLEQTIVSEGQPRLLVDVKALTQSIGELRWLHRLAAWRKRWGLGHGAIDLDLVFVEYDREDIVAVVSYQHEHASKGRGWKSSFHAFINLTNRADVPFFSVTFADDFSRWHVGPENGPALRYLPHADCMTPYEWVHLLYRLRGIELPKELFAEPD